MINKIIVSILISTVVILAQSEPKLSKERFNFLMDSLTTVKADLLLEKENLENAIDSLNEVKSNLEEQSKSSRVKQLVRKYGKTNGNRIAQGKVWKGMTEKMLEDSWGKPDKINKNKEKWGVFTQWFYGEITYFFRDGKMIDWEEKK